MRHCSVRFILLEQKHCNDGKQLENQVQYIAKNMLSSKGA